MSRVAHLNLESFPNPRRRHRHLEKKTNKKQKQKKNASVLGGNFAITFQQRKTK